MISDVIGTNEENITKSISNVNDSLSHINSITKDLASVINDVENGNGTAGALFKDAGMKTNISAIITNLKIFSEKLRDNPSVLLFREKEVK